MTGRKDRTSLKKLENIANIETKISEVEAGDYLGKDLPDGPESIGGSRCWTHVNRTKQDGVRRGA